MDTIDLRDNSPDTLVALMKQKNPGLESLLSVYPEEHYDKLLKHKDKLDKVIEQFYKVSSYNSMHSVVMKCNITTCPYESICILKKASIAPEGSSCPVEKKMVIDLESDIVESLKISRNDPIEMELLWDLIDTKILDMRTSGAMNNGALIQEIVSTVAGKIETSKQEMSPNVEVKLELKKLKHSIIDSFVATRRAKKKYGMQGTNKSLESVLLQGLNISPKIEETDVEET